MTTKDNFLPLFKDRYKSINYCHTEIGAEYSDLNLNQNLKGSNIFPIQSNSKSCNNKKIGNKYCCSSTTIKKTEMKTVIKRKETTINKISDYTFSERYEKKEKSETWKKPSATDLCSKYSNSLSLNDENKKCWKKNGSLNATNNSTLSLHISAYENLKETSSDSLNKSFQKSLFIQKQKQINPDPTFVSQNPFEFQRQQNDKVPESEVSQFKASQRLLRSDKSDLRSNTATTIMDGGVLAAMHQCIVQGDTFKKVEKDGNLYYKILDTYYPFDTPSNVRTFDNEGFYSVGTVGTFYLNHENQSAYTRNALELNVELVPRAHQKAIALYIQKGVINPDLVLADAPTISITSTEFEENDTAIEEIDKTSLNQSTTDENGRQMDASATSVRDLNPLLTAERVAQLASKAKQVRTQKSKTDRGFVLDAEVSDKNLDSIDKYLKYKTRVHKNTTNCMDSSANFSSVLSLISSMKSREHSTTTSLPKPPLAPNLQATNAQAKANPSQNNRGYSRYDQEVFHNDEADEFQIQTGMSFHGTSLKKINSLKTAAKPIADPVRQQLKRPYSSSSSNNAATNNKPQKRTSRTPIIIIPASGTALISMYNAMDILQDLKFVSTEEKKRVIQRRENELLIHRRKDNGQTVPYRIVDNPSRLTDEEWDRVVAVFVQGPAWQFKGWHWGGNPTTIFSHVKGFHLKFEDAKLDQNVTKWSVDVLSLSKQKRHLDKSIFIQLWQKIEQHIIRNKPALRV